MVIKEQKLKKIICESIRKVVNEVSDQDWEKQRAEWRQEALRRSDNRRMIDPREAAIEWAKNNGYEDDEEIIDAFVAGCYFTEDRVLNR